MVTPPDSGEREVMRREADRMRVVEIPADLAQRILAALEDRGEGCHLTPGRARDLADDLRKAMPK